MGKKIYRISAGLMLVTALAALFFLPVRAEAGSAESAGAIEGAGAIESTGAIEGAGAIESTGAIESRVSEFSAPSIKDGVYLLSSADDLYWFADAVNSGNASINARLTGDIRVNDRVPAAEDKAAGDDLRVWLPAGTYANPYKGSFDGNGFSVSGLYLQDVGASYTGFFGYIGSGGQVENLTIADSWLYGGNRTGAITGGASGAKIDRCVNKSVIRGDNYTGGIAGSAANSQVSYCKNEGAVYATNANTGGIAGYAKGGSILYSSNTGSVTGDGGMYTGGIVGMCESGQKVNYCFHTGQVGSELASVGGIAGGVSGGNIRYCYYLEGSAKCLRTPVDDPEGTKKTAGDFSGGNVCYLLNGGSVSNVAFYQTLGKDPLPLTDPAHGIVYKNGSAYSNTDPAKAGGAGTSLGKDTGSGTNRVAVGTVFSVGSGKNQISYQVTSRNKKQVRVKSVSKKAVTVRIPAKVTYGGISWKVTAIGAKACYQRKKLKSVTIGSNVTSIGKQAFQKDGRLKSLAFGGKKLTKIGSKAFAGGSKSVTVKVPKAKYKAYKSLLKKAGISKKAGYVKK